MSARKPVAPFYAAAAIWLCYALLFPLYAIQHYLLLIILSAAGFFLVNLLCRSAGTPAVQGNTAAEKKKSEPQPSTGNPALDKVLKDGAMAISEMKRLNDSIADPEVSADIEQLEQVCGKIFDLVKADPKKLPQIRKFMDYYLPTTLKLLNAYDRASAAGISGENIDTTKTRVAGMMKTIVAAFQKQLDALFGDTVLDISTDITVLETMMAQEGLSSRKSEPQKTQNTSDIHLEL